jgi:CheY-like chemotaxis protein
VDNGAVRDVAQLFEPHEGGVGLNICSQIVKDHGGELYAWSAYGHGTTLTMELPVYVQDKAGAGDASPSPIRGKSIMIIDDDVHITELLHEVLARRGATVEVSNSGPTAYDQLRCNDYDLILCDQNMPGLNGPTLFRLAEIWNPRIKNKFLFMTGDVVVGSAGPFSSETGVQYLRKPFRMQDLVDTVEAFFNRSLTPNS